MGKYGSTMELIRVALREKPRSKDDIAKIIFANSDGKTTLEKAKAQAQQRATQAFKSQPEKVVSRGGMLHAVQPGEVVAAADPTKALKKIFG